MLHLWCVWPGLANTLIVMIYQWYIKDSLFNLMKKKLARCWFGLHPEGTAGCSKSKTLFSYSYKAVVYMY